MCLLLLEEVDALLEDLSRDLVAFVLILHELVLEERRQMLEAIAIDSRHVEDGRVVDAPHCGSPATLEQVADLSEDASGVYLVHFVFTPCKVGTSDTALAL